MRQASRLSLKACRQVSLRHRKVCRLQVRLREVHLVVSKARRRRVCRSRRLEDFRRTFREDRLGRGRRREWVGTGRQGGEGEMEEEMTRAWGR